MTSLAADGAEPGRFRREGRTLSSVVHRDLLRMAAQPAHTALLLLQPLVFLLLLGGGLAALVPAGAVGGDYRTYMFPGILVMTVQSPAVGVGIRLIADRDSGYLRETLMAPAHRTTLLLGLCLGGTAVALLQGVALLALAGAVNLPYQPTLLISLLAVMALTALTLTALATALATALRNIQTFNTMLGLTMLPLTVLSGAFFPLTALPGWLQPLAALNPLTYAVDLMHHSIHAHTAGPAAPTGVRWGAMTPSPLLETVTLVALAALAFLAAARRFARPD
ncbi:ABC transporter permease [Spirillospora sp. NPDC050679]